MYSVFPGQRNREVNPCLDSARLDGRSVCCHFARKETRCSILSSRNFPLTWNSFHWSQSSISARNIEEISAKRVEMLLYRLSDVMEPKRSLTQHRLFAKAHDYNFRKMTTAVNGLSRKYPIPFHTLLTSRPVSLHQTFFFIEICDTRARVCLYMCVRAQECIISSDRNFY
jgi:hypothetical protein